MDELKRRLSALEIAISVTGKHEVTVYTTTEPLFCFVCETVDEAQELVKDTLTSYIQAFFGSEEVKFEFKRESAIPVKNLTPSEYIRPIFNSGKDESQSMAPA